MGRPIPRNLQAAHDKKWIPKEAEPRCHREKYRALLDAGWTILHSGKKSDFRVGYYAPSGVGFDSVPKAWAAHEAGKTDKGVIREYVSQAGLAAVRTPLNAAAIDAGELKERASMAGLAAVRTPLNAAAIDAGELKERASRAGLAAVRTSLNAAAIDAGELKERASTAGTVAVRTSLNAAAIDAGDLKERASRAGLAAVRTSLNAAAIDAGELKERASTAGTAAVRTSLNAAAIDAGDLKEVASRAGKRPSQAGKCNPANQRRSWAAAAARGTGETQDGLSPQEREDMAQQVAGEVNAVAIAALDHSGSTSVYVAVGSHRRMVTNLQEAKKKGWKCLGGCEVLASLLRSTPVAFVLDEKGHAQRFCTASLRKHLKAGNIEVFVSEECMHAASTAKRSEVLSHTELMQQYPHPRTLMSGISKGGPQQGQACGHALGVLMMHCMGEHFVAPQVDTYVLEIQASPAYRERKDELGSTWQEHAQQQASSSSAPLVLPPWSRAFTCKLENPQRKGHWHNKYWTASFEPENAVLVFTWGPRGESHTNVLRLQFGGQHAALANELGTRRCTSKLTGSRSRKTGKLTKAPYTELAPGEVLGSGGGGGGGGGGGTRSSRKRSAPSPAGADEPVAMDASEPAARPQRRAAVESLVRLKQMMYAERDVPFEEDSDVPFEEDSDDEDSDHEEDGDMD
ncbi:hypothetical protein EMIHUDRAFT_95152 [Emiliania huxleyi CCMP1516]|uniref:Uncharacterized protein n=2 Tax=Emiliania huxleyi TaxID=2903 RepID=A0A0D3L1S9_EMIH1|nr:hypothetical protein EMIHUDRAFT_95152 [Emiliania huxleyi CCMP1516]EOD41964.1 hypothetical protein EMIHUDRAFT_95152 [Emiliania huxleyi CCMP1516]|eukprot:XP_005794393.1 hypothetical protein EMIHUDRAFT_95152 [Emiliania huxleyi CCMP1516]